MNQWKQIEHPVSHTIVVQGKSEAQAEDILVCENEKYYVQGKDNPSELGFFEILYCEKRIGSG